MKLPVTNKRPAALTNCRPYAGNIFFSGQLHGLFESLGMGCIVRPG